MLLSKLHVWEPDEIVAILKVAAAAVDEAGVPDDLRPQAFANAVALRSQAQVTPGAIAVHERIL